MKSFSLTSFAFVCLLLCAAVFGACASSNQPGESGTTTTSVQGTVIDESGQPLGGVTVTSNTATTASRSDGAYSFSSLKVAEDRFFITFKKSGFFGATAAALPAGNSSTTQINAALMASVTTQSISAQSGGVVTAGDATLTFPASIIATPSGSSYSGQAAIAARYLSPDSSNFYIFISGGSTGKESTGSLVALHPFGVLRCELHGGSEEELGLTVGGHAKLTYPIPASLIENAPVQLAMWYFDAKTAFWIQEGTATRQGDNYVGDVSHFTDWMIADPLATATDADLPFQFNNSVSNSIWLSGDGKTLATPPDDGTIALNLHDASTGGFLKQIPIDNFCTIQLSYDASTLFDVCSSSKTLWNTATATVLRRYSNFGGPVGPEPFLMPDGRTAAVIEDTEIVILRLSDSVILRKLGFHWSGEYQIGNILAVSSDSSRILFTKYDNSRNTYYVVWDLQNNMEVSGFTVLDNTNYGGASSDLSAVAVTQPGNANSTDISVWFYDTRTGERMNPSVFIATQSFAFLDNERIFARKDGARFPGIYSIRSGALLQPLWSYGSSQPPDGLGIVGASADGSLAVAFHNSGTPHEIKVHVYHLK